MMSESLNRDFDRLRNENPQQFHTLVRMHLSFELDLNTDEYEAIYCEKGKLKKWNYKFHKKAKGCAAAKSGSPPDIQTLLTKDGIYQMEQLIDFLKRNENIIQEGIFRRTGSYARQSELKTILQQGKAFNVDGRFNVHDCASVFKGYLADLSEPLLTDSYHPAHCQLADICNNEDTSSESREVRLLTALQLLILLLPDYNRILFQRIIELLHEVIQYESQNKMSSGSLATLFTPHLICPRKLAPEILHKMSQSMSSVISFMITKGPAIFEIPTRLATDVRAYFVEQRRKRTMTPELILDESITSDSTANTVFTFVDREKTAAAHDSNTTDTALAQLYAHIQSLPESSRKRKLIKQFNKENGQGTPLQHVMLNRMKTTSSSALKSGKSLGDSIKKHIFNKGLISRTPKQTPLASGGEFDTPSRGTPTRRLPMQPKLRVLFQTPVATCTSFNNLLSVNDSAQQSPSIQKSSNRKDDTQLVELNSPCIANESFHPRLTDDFQNTSGETSDSSYNKLLLNNTEAKSRYKSEPNLSISCDINSSTGSASNRSSTFAHKLIKGVSLGNFFSNDRKHLKMSFGGVLKKTLNMSDESRETPVMAECATNVMKCETDRHWGSEYLMETPLQFYGRNSMSPITKSTQRMPKSMQESIMTPRSRKPVIFLGLNVTSSDANQSTFYKSCSSLNEEDEDVLLLEENQATGPAKLHRSLSDGDVKAVQEIISKPAPESTRSTSAPESLTSVFRDYLFSRSVLTASPVDLSFSSQPDDFGSSDDLENLTGNEMSDSLLYCLDGNQPDDLSFVSDENEYEGMDEDENKENDKNVVPTSSSRKRPATKSVAGCSQDGGQQHIKKMVLDNFELDETAL